MARNDLIFRIFSVIRSIESATALDQLNFAAREILKFVAERNLEGRPTRSSDVIQLRLGTAPTIYSRLSELEEAGWLKTVQDPEDARSKLLTLTPRANTAFLKMSKALIRLSSELSRSGS